MAGNTVYAQDPNYDESESKLSALLRLRLPALCSRLADGYDIQSQQMIENVDRYEEFVRLCASQAREADPGTLILAGITTDAPKRDEGDPPSIEQMIRATRAVSRYVHGHWLTGVEDDQYRKARGYLCELHGLPRTI